jgi:alanyl-tRNA synthetase
MAGAGPDRLAFSVYPGDDAVPRDEEAAALWRAQACRRSASSTAPQEQLVGPAAPPAPAGRISEMLHHHR